MMTSRLTDRPWPTLLFAALSLLPRGPVVAQQRGPDSIRAAVAAREAQIARAAAIFLDSSRSTDERAAGARTVSTFLRPEHIAGAFAVARNEREAPLLRALAVTRINHALRGDTTFAELLKGWAESPGTPAAMRAAAFDVIGVFMFSSPTRQEHDPRLIDALRRLTRDRDPEVRLRAFALLAPEGDPAVQSALLEGLRVPGQARVPPLDAVRLLGVALNDSIYPVLHEVMLRPPDPDTRLAALSLLGGYAPSRSFIVRYMQDPRETSVARLAAMATLHANTPTEFVRLALPVILDEQAGDELRTYGLQAAASRRHPLTTDSLKLGGDSLDQAARRLARESRSPAVRQAAATYLRSRGIELEP